MKNGLRHFALIVLLAACSTAPVQDKQAVLDQPATTHDQDSAIEVTGVQTPDAPGTLLTLYADGALPDGVEFRELDGPNRWVLEMPGVALQDGLIRTDRMPDIIKGIKVTSRPDRSRLVFQLKRDVPLDMEVSRNALRLNLEIN